MKTKIVATILAKNESDIIAQTIEHHLCNGVSQIILTDNNSTDDTIKIAERYPEVIEIIKEEDDTHNQSKHVTKMAKIACKLHPDWIVHLDADELWGGFENLNKMEYEAISCETMYLHPPINEKFSLNSFKNFFNFDNIPISQEAKIMHRPINDIEICHGNHGIVGKICNPTKKIYRHHYPIRSLNQWIKKSEGHLSLKRRGSCCERWEKWYNKLVSKELENDYSTITQLWYNYLSNNNRDDFISLIEFWCTTEVVNYFKQNNYTPSIGEWPCII